MMHDTGRMACCRVGSRNESDTFRPRESSPRESTTLFSKKQEERSRVSDKNEQSLLSCWGLPPHQSNDEYTLVFW
jgi:hypothetical protein